MTSLPWPARMLARSLQRRIRRRIADQDFRGLTPFGSASRESAETTFEGQTMRWSLKDSALEIELFREPCNEIGTLALAEFERLAELLKAGGGGARSAIFYSSVERGFCAGADLKELYQGLMVKKRDGASRFGIAREVRSFLDRIHAVFDAIDTTPITTVAAVHGFCFGGGLELALCCDIIVADKSARFAFPELRLGLIPGFGGIPRLNRDWGNAVVRDLLLTGRSLGSRRAHDVGLVSQLVGRGESLRAARSVAAQGARFDPQTTATAKQFMKALPRGALEKEKDLFIELLGSPTVERALDKFVHSDDIRPYLP